MSMKVPSRSIASKLPHQRMWQQPYIQRNILVTCPFGKGVYAFGHAAIIIIIYFSLSLPQTPILMLPFDTISNQWTLQLLW